MTKRRVVGDATESLPNTSPAHGNSTAEGVKQQTSKLLDELNSFVVRKQENGALCSVRKILESISEPERVKLQELLDNEAVLSSQLSLLLKKHGHYVSGDVVRRHRRRKVTGTGCACP